MQFFLGPMTPTVVSEAVKFFHRYHVPLTFIPSRRQVDVGGGYVGNEGGNEGQGGWTPAVLRDHVGQSIPIERDHAGPGQGAQEDEGWESLAEDVKHFDILHVDPWKAYPRYEDGLRWTVRMIRYCLARNPNIEFEVGTEEAIRPFHVGELRVFLQDLQNTLTPTEWASIRYVVVQCGTALRESHNVGSFDAARLADMLGVVAAYGKVAKEHNGDWVPAEVLKEKKALGLTAVNIAPELGAIESRALWNSFNEKDRETFFQLCWKSRKWCKWVSADFDPLSHKEDLVMIAGHYVLSHPDLMEIRGTYDGIEETVQDAICSRLKELYGIVEQ